MHESIDDQKKYELDKAWGSMRFFQEYRLKFFNFFIAANGALLTIVLVHLKDDSSKIVISLFSLFVSIIMALIDKRITQRARKYINTILTISKDLQLNHIYSLYSNGGNGFTLHNLFMILYVVIVVIWIILITLIKFNVFITSV